MLDMVSGTDDTVVFRDYLKKKSPVKQEVENRIRILTDEAQDPSPVSGSASAATPTLMSLQTSTLLHLSLTLVNLGLNLL